MSKSPSNLTYKLLGKIAHLNKSKGVPKAIQSFADLNKAALQSGVINRRTKQMLALAIAMTNHLSGCIDIHLCNLIKQELSYEELLELSAVAIYMGGGPAFACVSETLTRFQQMQPGMNLEH